MSNSCTQKINVFIKYLCKTNFLNSSYILFQRFKEVVNGDEGRVTVVTLQGRIKGKYMTVYIHM